MIRALRVRIGGLRWIWYVVAPQRPAPVPPMWAIRWVMAGSIEQRSALADRISRALRRKRALLRLVRR